MIDMSAQKMIKSEAFVREPVDKISRKIINSNLSKIILTGGRGTGKSVVLNNIEDKTLGQYEPFIYTKFDSYGMGYDKCDKEFYEHYYELNMAFRLLRYIKDNYRLTYEKYFKKYDFLLDVSAKTTYYMNNHIFTDKSLEEILEPYHLLKSHEITGKIKDDLMEHLNLHNLGIMINRFD